MFVLRQSVQKELGEELGIELNESQLQREVEWLAQVRKSQVLQDGAFNDNEIVDVYLLDRHVPVEDMKLQAVEVDEVKYVHINELQEIVEKKASKQKMHVLVLCMRSCVFFFFGFILTSDVSLFFPSQVATLTIDYALCVFGWMVAD